MEKQKLSSLINEWENTGEIKREMAKTVEKRFEEIIRYELGYIDELIEKKTPNRAFGRLTRFLSFINVATQVLPSIQKNTGGWIFQLRKRIDTIAKKLGAEGYNLTLEMPTGISITMVFKI